MSVAYKIKIIDATCKLDGGVYHGESEANLPMIIKSVIVNSMAHGLDLSDCTFTIKKIEAGF